MNRGLSVNQPSSIKQGVCPYLGLREDPSLIAARPTSAHTCHSGAPRQPLSPEHQRNYCMTAAYGRCAAYVAPLEAGQQIQRERGSARQKTRQRTLRDRNIYFLYIILGLVILALFALNAVWIVAPMIGSSSVVGSPTPTAEPEATSDAAAIDVPIILAESPATQSAEGNELVDSTGPEASHRVAGVRYVTPTPVAGGGVREILPNRSQVGWWSSDGQVENSLMGDSFMYAGVHADLTYISAVQFDLARVPRGAPILYVSLHLSGLRDTFLDLDSSKSWLVQLIAESELSALSGATFLSVYSAPASIALLPVLNGTDLAEVTPMNGSLMKIRAVGWNSNC